MGFPTRACMELTSDDAMKQSLRLVKDVSLSMSWNAGSLPAERRCGDVRQGLVAEASFKKHTHPRKHTHTHTLKSMQSCTFEIYCSSGKL